MGFVPNNVVISTGQRATGEKATFGFGSVYALVGVGNRTQVDLTEPLIPGFEPGSVGYTYNLGNILATADSATYTHDANGNRTSKTNGTNGTSYTYDPLNQLTQVTDGTQTTQYIYNGLGQRVGRIVDGVQTNYLIDPNGVLPQVLAEMDGNGDLLAFYVYDGVGLVTKITPENAYYFYHYDGLGNTVAITDSSGAIVNAYAYSPYGLVGSEETIENSFQYVGRFGVMAEGNGLYFMKARYYDPEVGRFINKDPIGYVGGINLFTYTANNPINYIDALGLKVFYHGHTVNQQMEEHLKELSNYTDYDIHLTSGTRNGPTDNPYSQHFTGNAADFYMTNKAGKMINMKKAAYITADYGEFTGIGYYSGSGPHGAHVHADLRCGENLYWSETDYTGYHYNNNSVFWRSYFKSKKLRAIWPIISTLFSW